MPTLFKRLRKKLIEEGQLKKYLLYAIGEIVLVVAGILIALSINNWNEASQKEQELKSILNIVKQNMEADTSRIGDFKKGYEERLSLMDTIVKGKVDRAFIENCPPCWGLTASFSDVVFNTKGYELLNNYKENRTENDSIFIKLELLYGDVLKLNDIITDMIKEETEFSLNHIRQFDFFISFLTNEPNDKMIDYFYKNSTHLNNVAMHQLLLKSNYFPLLDQYVIASRELMIEIDRRIED